MIQEMIEKFETAIKTCRLIETRMVDHYVLMDPEDGTVLTTENGVRPFHQRLDDIQRTRDLAAIKRLLKHVREENPDNPVAQRLVITGWKKAARIQRERAEETLQMLREKTT